MGRKTFSIGNSIFVRFCEVFRMEMEWMDGFTIRVSISEGTALLSANREGLLSLAKQLTALASAAPGSHLHYDAYNSLEEGSSELIIEKI